MCSFNAWLLLRINHSVVSPTQPGFVANSLKDKELYSLLCASIRDLSVGDILASRTHTYVIAFDELDKLVALRLHRVCSVYLGYFVLIFVGRLCLAVLIAIEWLAAIVDVGDFIVRSFS